MTKRRQEGMPGIRPVGAVLQDLLGERGLSERLHRYRAFSCWKQVVGPQIAAQAQPLRIRDGRLEVRVAHPVWMQQLQLLKPRILARLAEHLGNGVISDIYLRQGRLTPEPLPEEQNPGISWQTIHLSPEEERQVAEILARIKDAELRRVMERVLRRQKQLAGARRAAQDDASKPSAS